MAKEIKTEKIKISKIKLNPNNPRLIKDDNFAKLVQSVKDFPEMLEIRPIVVNKDFIVLGGNMRFRACIEAGLKEVPVIVTNLSQEKQREFLIKDNVSGGDWDWNLLANEWDNNKLEGWGVKLTGFDGDGKDLGTDFELPSGEKSGFQQMTFNLADEQVTEIKNAIEEIKRTEEYKYVETFANENSNGNALYLIIMKWVELRK